MKKKIRPAYKELKTVSFIALQTGDKFDVVQGDYIYKHQNAARRLHIQASKC